MSKLSEFIAHDLTTTGSTQILGADQAQLLAPLENPLFKNGITINGVGGTQPSISLNKDMTQKLYLIADDDLGQSNLVTSYPMSIDAPSLVLPSGTTIVGLTTGITETLNSKMNRFDSKLTAGYDNGNISEFLQELIAQIGNDAGDGSYLVDLDFIGPTGISRGTTQNSSLLLFGGLRSGMLTTDQGDLYFLDFVNEQVRLISAYV